MAYAVKYLFKFQSSNGTVREIRVLKDGYSGSVIQRPLGRAPVIKKEKNGGVHGTSLTFYAECHIDREYIEFYTSDPKEYRVDVYAGSTLLWQGYITPELYSEPDIAPPYDVQVVATDGVGELKLYDFAPQGTVTLRALLAYLLGYTGLTTDVNLVSSLKPGSRGAGALLDMQICVDYLAGKTCYEALTYILTTLHATITRWGGAWVLVRETNVTFTGDKVRYFNTSGNSALLTGSVQTLGAMRAAPAWPVGQLSTVIDPAKNKVVVQAPWHPVSGLDNSGMTSDTGWTKDKNARYDTDGYVLPTNVLTPVSETAVISQAVSLVGLRVALSISVKATGSTSEIAGQTYGALMGVFVTYKVGNVTYYLIKGEDGAPAWEQGDNIGTYVPPRTRVDYQQTLSVWDASRIEAEELKIDNIPPFLSGTSFPSGTLTVYILGSCVKVYGAYLDVMLPKGYQDVLRIDNGARGEGDSVEIAIGRVTSEVAYYQSFLQGLLLDTGSIITAFSDANFTTAMDYLALISRDYALSAALPRALAKGTVYLESSIGMPPLVFAKGGLNYWLETWSWDLYEDELEIDARTLPSASLTVQSETILESDGSTVSSSSSGSSGGGSSISPGGGVTYFEPHNDGIILKADYEYVSVPDVLLGDDEESLNALLAVIAGNAVQGAAAYGYFSNGVLPYNHGGTGISSYTKGDLLYASANNTLAKLAANSTGTKKFLTMTSSVPSWDGIAFGDLPTLYWADVAVSSSSSTTTEPTVKSITIGGATLTWVAPVGTTPGYLRINSPLLTDGDQIVGSGTPGGGGGGGASYLYELKDFQSGQSKATTTGTMLMYQATDIVDVEGNTGAWKYASPSDVAAAIGLGDYLPLAGGTMTGVITAQGSLYTDDGTTGGLNMANSNIVKVNGIYTADNADSPSEGISFYRTATTVDSLWASSGVLYFTPNRTLGTDGTSYTVLHSGNYTSTLNNTYLPLAGGTMTGAIKMNYVYQSGANFRFINNRAVSDSSGWADTVFGIYNAAESSLASIGIHGTADTLSYLYIGSNGYNGVNLRINSSSIKWGDDNILHAGNYTSYALPRSGGSSYPMTGTLFLATGSGISDASGNGMLVYHPTGWTGVTSSQWGVGAIDSQGVIRSSATNLVHYRGSTSYDIADKYVLTNLDYDINRVVATGVDGGYKITGTSYAMRFMIGSGGTNRGIYSDTTGAWMLYFDASNTIINYGNLILPDGKLTVLGSGTNAIYLTQTSINWHNTSNTWASSLIGFESANIKIQQTTTHSGGHIYLTGAVANSSTANTTQIVFGTSSSNHVVISSNTDSVIINPTTSSTTGQIILGVNSTTSSFGNSVTFKGAANRFVSDTWTNVGIKRAAAGGAWICFYPSNQETYFWNVGASTVSSNSTNFSFEYQGNGIKAYLTPSGTFSTNGDQVISSDATLKTNLQDVTYGVADIAKTRAVTFDWKDGRGKSAGSIAQDWKPLIPELVHGEEGDMTLAYGQIALVNTIIEAREIDVLKKWVAELEAEVKRLRS